MTFDFMHGYDWSSPETVARELVEDSLVYQGYAWKYRGVPVDSFYGRTLEDPEDWVIVEPIGGDHDLLDQSNQHEFEEALSEVMNALDAQGHGDVEMEYRNMRYLFIRAYWPRGYFGPEQEGGERELTPLFREYCRLMDRYSQYPVLSEEDHSRREYEATLENIVEVGRRFLRDDAPDDWASQCFSWFWDNDQSAVESRDGGGGYPSDDEIQTALLALGLLDPEYWPALWEEDGVGDLATEDNLKERGLR